MYYTSRSMTSMQAKMRGPVPMGDASIAGWAALQATSLREQAREVLRASIVSGAIKPGVIHSVPSLAAQLGVSVTPVREAMLDLATEGLVQPIRNRGFRVAEMSEQDLDEILELRLLLEVPSAGRLARTLDARDLERLRSVAEHNATCAAEGDVVGYLETDRQLHLGLLETLGNHRLTRTVAQLRDQARPYGLGDLARTGELRASAEEHLRLLTAIGEGDSDLAEQLTRRHLEHTRGIWDGRGEQDGKGMPPRPAPGPAA